MAGVLGSTFGGLKDRELRLGHALALGVHPGESVISDGRSADRPALLGGPCSFGAWLCAK